jgi:hypothetical protein
MSFPLTGDSGSLDLVNVVPPKRESLVACLSSRLSTFRGSKGVYVVDLFVMRGAAATLARRSCGKRHGAANCAAPNL